jgi:hypothetical protein
MTWCDARCIVIVRVVGYSQPRCAEGSGTRIDSSIRRRLPIAAGKTDRELFRRGECERIIEAGDGSSDEAAVIAPGECAYGPFRFD